MSTRVVVVLLGLVLAMAGCDASPTPPPSVSVAPAPVRPAGAQQITTAPEAGSTDCGDREASLRPTSQPSPGAMPPGSTMAAIEAAGTAHRRR